MSAQPISTTRNAALCARAGAALGGLWLLAASVAPPAAAHAPRVTFNEDPCGFLLVASHGAIDHDYTQGLWGGSHWSIYGDPKVVQDADGFLAGWDTLSVIGKARHAVGPHGEGQGPEFNFGCFIDGSVEDNDITADTWKVKTKKDFGTHGEHLDLFARKVLFYIETDEDIHQWFLVVAGKHTPCDEQGHQAPAWKTIQSMVLAVADSGAYGGAVGFVSSIDGTLSLYGGVEHIRLQDVISARIMLGPPPGGMILLDLTDALLDDQGLLVIYLPEAQLPAQAAEWLLAGQAYLTIQTLAFPQGEVSGLVELMPENCAGDLDGDDVVGTADLLALLAAWGDPYGTADLLALLGAWGPCPGPGDCCFAGAGPGCGDPQCQGLVCTIDPFCCEVLWDAICAETATDTCDGCP